MDDWLDLFYEAYGRNMYGSCPKEWNKCYHIRPQRRKEKTACRKVTLDNMGEEIMFPVHGKPHIYYW